MTFALDLSAFAKKTDLRMEAVVRRIVLDVAKSLVEMSPVGDADYWKSPPPKGYVGGRFKASWDYGFNSPPSDLHRGIDPSGAASLNRIEAGIDGKMGGAIHYLANNAPYAMRLEEGWSRQAPHGMVELTAMKFQAIVDEAAAAEDIKA